MLLLVLDELPVIRLKNLAINLACLVMFSAIVETGRNYYCYYTTHYTSYFVPFLIQETDILTDNLAKHTLNDSEVLFETRDLRTLANLQESMVRR